MDKLYKLLAVTKGRGARLLEVITDITPHSPPP